MRACGGEPGDEARYAPVQVYVLKPNSELSTIPTVLREQVTLSLSMKSLYSFTDTTGSPHGDIHKCITAALRVLHL